MNADSNVTPERGAEPARNEASRFISDRFGVTLLVAIFVAPMLVHILVGLFA